MKASSLRSAGLSSVAGSLSTAAAIFLIFRAGVQSVGTAQMGAWALMQGLFLFARIADSGVGVNLTRRYSLARASGPVAPTPFLFAGWLAGSAPVIVAVAITFVPVTHYVATQSTGVVGATTVWQLAVLCCGFAVLASATAVIFAVCDGAKIVASRNVVMIVGNVVSVVVVHWGLASHGILGVGLAYVVGSSIQLLGGGILVSLLMTPARPHYRTLHLLREIWRENLQLMSMAITRLSFEPTSKFFLSLVAPLSFIAAFDLALKVTSQGRLLMQSIFQPLVSFAAGDRQSPIEGVRLDTFQRAAAVLSFLLWLALDAMSAGVLLLSVAAFGDIDGPFVACSMILIVANVLNASGLIGYYVLASSGDFNRLLRIQIIMAVANLGVGLCGLIIGSRWLVIIGLGLALSYGGWAMRRDAMTVLKLMRRAAPFWNVVRSSLVMAAVVLGYELSENVQQAAAASILLAALVAAAHTPGALRLVASSRTPGGVA